MDTGILFNGMYLGSASRQRSDGKVSYFSAADISACSRQSYFNLPAVGYGR